MKYSYLFKGYRFRDSLIIAFLCLIFFVPFLGSVHLYDWDEINFAEASREMLVTNNYTRVTINYEPFWEKPPLFFWLQTFSMRIFGINEFGARFVNVVTGIITLIILYLIGNSLYSRLFGIMWASAFGGSILPHVFFKSGIIDPVFNLFIFLGIFFITKHKSSNKSFFDKEIILSGIFTGLAVLTKGPVGGLIVSLVWFIFAILRSFKLPIKKMILFAITATVISSMFYALETLMHGTWFIREFIKYHIKLLSTSEAGHGEPFYYHFFVLLLGCFPASIFAARALFLNNTKEDTEKKFFLKWMKILFWVVFIVFSIVKTKTVLYSSLTYYPISFLATWYVYNQIKGKNKLGKTILIPFTVIGSILGIVIFTFPVILKNKELILPYIDDSFTHNVLLKNVHWTGFEGVGGIFYLFVVIISIYLFKKDRILKGFFIILIATALLTESFLIFNAPKIESHTQGGLINFYENLSQKDCYTRALYKSYADHFYTQRMPYKNNKAKDKKWLLKGNIDKPVYFVVKSNKANKYIKKYKLTKLKEEYGFTYLKRELNN